MLDVVPGEFAAVLSVPSPPPTMIAVGRRVMADWMVAHSCPGSAMRSHASIPAARSAAFNSSGGTALRALFKVPAA